MKSYIVGIFVVVVHINMIHENSNQWHLRKKVYHY